MSEKEPQSIEQIFPNPFDELTPEEQEIVVLAVQDTLPGWELNKDPLRLTFLAKVDGISPSLAALLEQFDMEAPRGEILESDNVTIAVKAEHNDFRLDRMAIVSLTEVRVVALG